MPFPMPFNLPPLFPMPFRMPFSPCYHPPTMEFFYDEIDNDVLIIRADGGLNADTGKQFLGDIETLVNAGLRKIIVDCSGLEYVSSFGLGILVRLHKGMKRHGGDVKVAGVKGVLADVLRITRLNTLFDVYGDVNRARLAFRPVEPSEKA